MSLLDRAREDIEQITSDTSGWAKAITLVSQDGSVTLTVNGLHTKHHLGINTDGNRVSAKNAHISLSERFLKDANYPVRNAAGQVSLKDHKIIVTDSTGNPCQYLIKEVFPNETIGLITCILGDFK